MQINDSNTVIDRGKCSNKENGEYQIDKVHYQVNRLFGGDKTIKEILFQKITCDYSASHN